MKRNSFEAFRPTTSKINIAELESKYCINLPFYYRQFVSAFYLGKNSLNKELYEDEKEHGLILPILSYFSGDGLNYISIDEFLSVSEAFEFHLIDSDEIIDMIKIASTSEPQIGGLYLGIGPENQDCIYKVDLDYLHTPSGIVKLADNIFQFALGIKSVEISHNNVHYSRLFKSWEDEYWRFK